MFILSLGVSADEKNKYQKETDFLNSIYMPMEYVQNIYSVDNSVVFEMNYSENGEISRITYTENNGDITVFIDENTRSNEIIFKKDGEVYIDGARMMMSSGNILKYKATIKYATSIPAGLQNVYMYNSNMYVSGYNDKCESLVYYKVETLLW